jgi:phosphoribosylglycinamide formyltransferase 2
VIPPSELSDQADFRDERVAGLSEDPLVGEVHEGPHLAGFGSAQIDDHVRVPMKDPCPPEHVALETTGIDQTSGTNPLDLLEDGARRWIEPQIGVSIVTPLQVLSDHRSERGRRLGRERKRGRQDHVWAGMQDGGVVAEGEVFGGHLAHLSLCGQNPSRDEGLLNEDRAAPLRRRRQKVEVLPQGSPDGRGDPRKMMQSAEAPFDGIHHEVWKDIDASARHNAIRFFLADTPHARPNDDASEPPIANENVGPSAQKKVGNPEAPNGQQYPNQGIGIMGVDQKVGGPPDPERSERGQRMIRKDVEPVQLRGQSLKQCARVHGACNLPVLPDEGYPERPERARGLYAPASVWVELDVRFPLKVRPMARSPDLPKTLLLLGSGELGKEVAIAAQRLGVRVVAADRYAGAPAMQVAHVAEVFSMLDGDALEAVIRRHAPDFVVPEVEAIRTERLRELEADGVRVIPTAEAAWMTMNREAIRDLAARELGLRTAPFTYAESLDELQRGCDAMGYPCVVKPVMSSSGKGQSVVSGPSQVDEAWERALEGGRGDQMRVIIEGFVSFHTEITLLTVREWDGTTHFLPPIAHRQEQGDYRESWMPAGLDEAVVRKAETMARTVTDRLGGAGIFGVEFFITDDEVVFSELSPRPHDTGMVTLISHAHHQFELHLRAILGLPIPAPEYRGPAASAVILAGESGRVTGYTGVREALQVESVDLRIFGKEDAWPFRRMGVVLARGATVTEARTRALEAASRITIQIAPKSS